MSKTFIYTKITKTVYLANTDENEEFGEEFEYEVDDEMLLDTVTELIFDDYFRKSGLMSANKYGWFTRKALKKFIEDTDSLEQLVKYYEDSLKDYFEEEAMENML